MYPRASSCSGWIPTSLILGDALHNLRSALDHLATSLVIVSGGRPNTDVYPRTQFPLFLDRLDKGDAIRDVTIKPKLMPAGEAILERTQPYNRTDDPTRHPLAILNELSNVDKHRVVNLTQGAFGRISVTLRRKSDGAILGHDERVSPSIGNAVVAVFPAVDFPPPDQVDVDAKFAPLVTLDVPTKLARFDLRELLDEMSASVRQVAEEFAVACFQAEPGLFVTPRIF
jgi:hypothetical protein